MLGKIANGGQQSLINLDGTHLSVSIRKYAIYEYLYGTDDMNTSNSWQWSCFTPRHRFYCAEKEKNIKPEGNKGVLFYLSVNGEQHPE